MENEQKTGSQKKPDQAQISLWIGVSILILVGAAITAYGLYFAANPGATMAIPIR